MPAGAPRKWKSVSAMQKAIDAYFESCEGTPLLDDDGYADTVTRAKARCEEYAEARLYDRDGANGAKFSLGCNFGWNSGDEKNGDPAALAALLAALKSDGNAG